MSTKLSVSKSEKDILKLPQETFAKSTETTMDIFPDSLPISDTSQFATMSKNYTETPWKTEMDLMLLELEQFKNHLKGQILRKKCRLPENARII